MPPWEFWPHAHLLMMMLDFSNIALIPNSLNFYLCTFTSSTGRKKCVRVLLWLLNFPFYSTTIDLLYCIFMTKKRHNKYQKYWIALQKWRFQFVHIKKSVGKIGNFLWEFWCLWWVTHRRTIRFVKYVKHFEFPRWDYLPVIPWNLQHQSPPQLCKYLFC